MMPARDLPPPSAATSSWRAIRDWGQRWMGGVLAGDPERQFEIAIWVTFGMTGLLSILAPTSTLRMATGLCACATMLTLWARHYLPMSRPAATWVLWLLVQAITITGIFLQGGLWSSAMGYFFVGNVGMLIIVSMRSVWSAIGLTLLSIVAIAAIEILGHMPTRTVATEDTRWWLVLYAFQFAGFIGVTLVVHLTQKKLAQNLRIDNRALSDAHEQLRQQHRMQEQFVASVSHELRTPVNAIMGFIQTIERNEHMPPAEQQALQYMEQSAQQLLLRINELLDFSQLQAKRLRIRDHSFNLHDLLERLIETLRESTQGRPLSVMLDIDGDVPKWVLGDAERLAQILNNLADNAVKFTPLGFVRLHVSVPRPGQVQFAVIDTGPGIDASELERIFNRLSTITSRTRREMGGTGLGLSITKALVELMHGELSVKSRLGVGSTFTVVLPLAQTEHESAPSQSIDLLAEAETITGRLLLVDDSPVNRLVAKNLLSTSLPQLIIEEAANGFRALAMVQERHYDMVLMDVIMPGKSGIEATLELKQTPKVADLVVFALTADASEDVRDACIQAGMAGLILKPFDRKSLLEPVLRTLRARTPEQRDSL